MSPDQAAVRAPVEWRPGRVGLNYRLGESLLFTVWRSGLTCDAHFSELSVNDPPPLPLEEARRAAVEVCVVRSQPVSATLRRISRVDGWIRYVPHRYDRHFVELTGSFEDYLMHFSGKSRYTIRRHVRRFAEASGGTIDFREYATARDLDAFRPLALELAAKTYQMNVLGCSLPAESDFWRRAREAAERGAVRAYLLFLAGHPVAFIYCVAVRGIVEQRFIGFDPDYREHAPGVVLLYRTLQSQFAAAQNRIYDFTEGESLQKRQFGTRQVSCADIYFFRSSPAIAAVVGLHCAMDYLSASLGVGLEALGVKRSVKHLIRALRRG